MALTEAERERVKFHLGYPTTSTAAGLTFGLARPMQTLFVVETAMNLLPQVSEPRVRRYLQVLDDIETKLVEAQDRLAATQLEDLYLRQNEPDMLELEYDRWANRLANVLGAPIYPYAKRFSYGSGVNIPVRG